MKDKINSTINVLPPFKKFCMTIGELPASYLETMTYYEMLIWFTKFLGETVIPTVNNNALAVEELQELFVKLQTYVNDYFDNLDVQEEINNKLDDMVEQGTLQEIITDYLNSKAIFCYDTVNDMKNNTNLINGSFAKTLGYYAKNDNGGALYKIVNAIPSTPTTHYETLNNSLYAELIIEEPLNVRSVGLNDTTDCSTKLQEIIDLGIKNLYFPKGTYHFNTGIVTEEIYWNLDNNAELIANDEMDCLISINENAVSRIQNMYFKGGIINGNLLADVCLGLNKSQYFRFENVFIKNFLTCGIEFDYNGYPGDSGGSFIKNCIIWGDSDNSEEIGVNFKTIGDSYINDTTFKDCKTAMKIQGGNIKVTGCHGWCSTETKYIESIFADVRGAGRTAFVDCVIDTMQYGVYGGTSTVYTSLINTVFMNRSSYGDTNIPVIVYSETSFNNYSGVNMNGLLISANTGKVKIISDSLLAQKESLEYQTYNGLMEYQTVSNIEVLNNPGNTSSYSYKISFGGTLNKATNFDNLKLSFYQLNMYTGESTGTNIPGTDFTGILYNIVSTTNNNDKNNGFQMVFTSTGKIITRYKKGNTWTSWNTFSKDV